MKTNLTVSKITPMFRLATVISFSLAAVLTSAQSKWQSANSNFIDDLPFTEDGNLVFSEVVEVSGASAEDLSHIFHFGFIPLSKQNEIPMISKNENLWGYYEISSSSWVNATVDVKIEERFEFKPGKYRHLISVVNIRKTHKWRDTKHNWHQDVTVNAPAFYFSKANYYKNSGNEKRDNENIKTDLINFIAKRIDYFKGRDWNKLIKNGKEKYTEERVKNWKSEIPDMPNELPFKEYLDKTDCRNNYSIVYEGVVKTSLSKSNQIKNLIDAFNFKIIKDDFDNEEVKKGEFKASLYEGLLVTGLQTKPIPIEKKFYIDYAQYTLSFEPSVGFCRYHIHISYLSVTWMMLGSDAGTNGGPQELILNKYYPKKKMESVIAAINNDSDMELKKMQNALSDQYKPTKPVQQATKKKTDDW